MLSRSPAEHSVASYFIICLKSLGKTIIGFILRVLRIIGFWLFSISQALRVPQEVRFECPDIENQIITVPQLIVTLPTDESIACIAEHFAEFKAVQVRFSMSPAPRSRGQEENACKVRFGAILYQTVHLIYGIRALVMVLLIHQALMDKRSSSLRVSRRHGSTTQRVQIKYVDAMRRYSLQYPAKI